MTNERNLPLQYMYARKIHNSQAGQISDHLVRAAVACSTDAVLSGLRCVSRRHSYWLVSSVVQQTTCLIGAVSAVIGRVTEL